MHIPEQERVFHILSKSIIIAAKCERSPVNRKMFMAMPFLRCLQ